MIDATTALVARLRELDAKAANGALPGTPRQWCAILDDPNEPPGIYTEGYSIIRDDGEADHDDLRLIAEMRNALPALLGALEKATTALQAIDAIRNDIIARQGIGWSRHVYPLVAALGDAGYEGEGYEKGRPRIEADDATIARLTARVAELEAAQDKRLVDFAEEMGRQHAGCEAKREAAEKRVAELESERVAWREWSDKDDEWSGPIGAAFPTKSGSHREYATAMQMVGRRHSKGALVALVNWLLVRVGSLEGRLSSTIDVHQRATQASHEHFNESRSALDVRISALEDTIDLERAKAIAGMCTCGVCDPNVTELASIANAAATISAIESRRGAGWKGAR